VVETVKTGSMCAYLEVRVPAARGRVAPQAIRRVDGATGVQLLRRLIEIAGDVQADVFVVLENTHTLTTGAGGGVCAFRGRACARTMV
jgi:hypothetical protein